MWKSKPPTTGMCAKRVWKIPEFVLGLSGIIRKRASHERFAGKAMPRDFLETSSG